MQIHNVRTRHSILTLSRIRRWRYNRDYTHSHTNAINKLLQCHCDYYSSVFVVVRMVVASFYHVSNTFANALTARNKHKIDKKNFSYESREMPSWEISSHRMRWIQQSRTKFTAKSKSRRRRNSSFVRLRTHSHTHANISIFSIRI